MANGISPFYVANTGSKGFMFHCYLSLPECKLIGFKSIRLDLAISMLSEKVSKSLRLLFPSRPLHLKKFATVGFLYKMARFCTAHLQRLTSGRSGFSQLNFRGFEKKGTPHNFERGPEMIEMIRNNQLNEMSGVCFPRILSSFFDSSG